MEGRSLTDSPARFAKRAVIAKSILAATQRTLPTTSHALQFVLDVLAGSDDACAAWTTAEIRVAAVEALHTNDRGVCPACTSLMTESVDVEWPCPTMRAMGWSL